MNNSNLWSLRLGFSIKQAPIIEKIGISEFLKHSFQYNVDQNIPTFLDNSPKSLKELKAIRKKFKESNTEDLKDLIKKETKTSFVMKAWWIDQMIENEYPLREKMTCFWHNHFVSTFQKVKVNYWIYQHNQILREHAFGNFKTLTKKIIQSNAMVFYLDNIDNKKGKLNENLSRELLELFTLGIGNYNELDVKNGAKGLAGLGFGEENATYLKFFQDDEPFTYFDKKGSFKIDEMVEIIFSQPKIPYLLTKKILKWFIYDQPDEELVTYYGDYFRKVNFEIQPLLAKIITEEFYKKSAGSKIKNPIEFILPLIHELQIEKPNTQLIAFFLKQQGMDLFNQPNVKGWDGGNSWLTSQVYLQRNNVSDLLCNGKNLNQRKKEYFDLGDETDKLPQLLNVKLHWNKSGTNKDIIAELVNRMLFQVDEALQMDFEKILKYDFDGNTPGSDNAVLRLFNAITKTPEYQLI